MTAAAQDSAEIAVHVAGVRLVCTVAGPQASSEPDVLLLHALGESAADWAAVTEALSGLGSGSGRRRGRGRRVYAPDLRGHGRSDWPGAYSLELMRADVLGVLDELGLARVDLIGHSLGGVVAHLVAQHSPARVRRMVLEDVPPPRPREPGVPERPPGELDFDWDMVLAVRKQLDTPDPAWLDGLAAVTARTLVIGGGPSSHVPQEGIAELAARIRDARHVTVPVGHLVHREAPDEFTALAADFLA